MPHGSSFVIATHVALLPHFNPDVDPETVAVVTEWIDLVRIADGLVVSTPEYAGGYPGSLKNALDWLVQGDAHIEKPFMLLNASQRSVKAQATLTTVLETMSGVNIECAKTTIPLRGKRLSQN